jgi:hypothetical protein
MASNATAAAIDKGNIAGRAGGFLGVVIEVLKK